MGVPPIETPVAGPSAGVIVEVEPVMPVRDLQGDTASTSSGDPSPTSNDMQRTGSGLSSHCHKRSRSNFSSGDFSAGDGLLSLDVDKDPASAPVPPATTSGTSKSKKPMPCRPVPMNSGPAPPGQVHIKIIDENLQGSCFAVEPTTKFEKLKRAFAEQSGRKEKDFM
eukprot:9029185-Pyramimonas_sp.AAC.1